MEYLITLILLLLVTIILEKVYHIHLYHNRKERLEITGLFFLIGVVWDSFAVWRGQWSFSGDKMLGLTIGVLPIEEYIFFLIVPFFIMTVYKIFDSKFRGKK